MSCAVCTWISLVVFLPIQVQPAKANKTQGSLSRLNAKPMQKRTKPWIKGMLYNVTTTETSIKLDMF